MLNVVVLSVIVLNVTLLRVIVRIIVHYAEFRCVKSDYA